MIIFNSEDLETIYTKKRSDLIILAIKRAKNNHGWKKNNLSMLLMTLQRNWLAANRSIRKDKNKDNYHRDYNRDLFKRTIKRKQEQILL